MTGLGFIRRAIVIVTLCGFGLSEAEAIEIIGGPSPVAHMNDGMVLQAQVGQGGVQRGGTRRGGAHRPVHRPPVHRPPVHRPPVHRPPVYRPVHPVYRGGVWARPTWYSWSPGGAVAAGAAIGFVTAATAAAWAGAPPQSGLCWFYNDPSRRQGFWDQCP
jgi:hypothetical protein